MMSVTSEITGGSLELQVRFSYCFWPAVLKGDGTSKTGKTLNSAPTQVGFNVRY